jgi:hypothetical protein
MHMQRMGPPPNLQAAYEELNSGTVAIRDSSTGHVAGTGMFMGSSLELARLPAVSSLLPAWARRTLEIGGSDKYLAIFISPLRYIRASTVVVDAQGMQLPGAVIRTDKALGLAAITATVKQDQLSRLDSPPPFLDYPRSPSPLRLLILRRNPDDHHRSSGFVLTSGGLGTGQSWCDSPVSGADSGAPLGYVSPSGSLFLAGLAMPSAVPGRCSILGAWTIGRFLALLEDSR